jgi:hypothetical protein
VAALGTGVDTVGGGVGVDAAAVELLGFLPDC